MSWAASPTQAFSESDGESINITAPGTILSHQPVYADGWLGMAAANIASGANGAIIVNNEEWQVYVPSAATYPKGSTIYFTLASAVGGTFPDAAYSITPGVGKRAYAKTTSAVMTASDGTKFVTAKLLPEGQRDSS